MKTRFLYSAVITLLLYGAVYGQSQDASHILEFKLNNKTHEVGLYGGLSVSYFKFTGDKAGLLSYQVGLVLDHKLGIGITGTGLAYDQHLTGLVDDGTYHINSGWNGAYIERIFNIAPGLKASLGWHSGRGVYFYRYDNEYRPSKTWTEEIIDGDTYFVNKPTLQVRWRFAGNWWLGAEAAYTLSSPIHLIGADKNAMTGASTGISIAWGIY